MRKRLWAILLCMTLCCGLFAAFSVETSAEAEPLLLDCSSTAKKMKSDLEMYIHSTANNDSGMMINLNKATM